MKRVIEAAAQVLTALQPATRESTSLTFWDEIPFLKHGGQAFGGFVIDGEVRWLPTTSQNMKAFGSQKFSNEKVVTEIEALRTRSV